MRVREVGVSALLVEVDDAVAAAGLATWLRREHRTAAVDVVPAASTVLLDGLHDPADRAAARDLLRGLAAVPTPPPTAGHDPEDDVVEIPVHYDGDDLAIVAEAWGTDVDGVVRQHTGTAFTAAFCGFAPGFTYLAGLPAALAVPRLTTPRPRLAAGSVAVADRWCGVYPSASPGGWRVLGHTDAVLWDVDRADPALLAPGTRVRFVVR